MPPRPILSRLLAGLVLVAGVSCAAQAALVDRGGGLIYDTDLNVTWLADANYAKTSGYDADGLMTWGQATTWAANLSYYDIVRDVTHTGWRLPTTTDIGATGCNWAYSGTDCGYNVDPASSEMAHLFMTELGNKSVIDTAGVPVNYENYNQLFNRGPFSNLQSDFYWSGTEDASYPNQAWVFHTSHNYQGIAGYNPWYDPSCGFFGMCVTYYYALAVHPGDVAAVPEAQAYALMLAGLGLIGWRARRRGLFG